MSNKYADMTTEQLDNILTSILEDIAAQLLSIPGIYEILAEEFNNEVLERYEDKQDEG